MALNYTKSWKQFNRGLSRAMIVLPCEDYV